MMKTYSAKPSDVSRTWFLLDASDASMGRIATKAATLLTGKEKPIFTSHIDCGDYVVIINTDKLVVTGSKEKDKRYYRHSGYPSGLTEISLKDKKATDSTSVLKNAIRGMLPVNKLRDARLLRLKIYPTSDHNHTAQTPTKINLSQKNKSIDKLSKKEDK